MKKLTSSLFFKVISLVLINSFLLLDIAWAGGDGFRKQISSSNLAAPIQINSNLMLAGFAECYKMKNIDLTDKGINDISFVSEQKSEKKIGILNKLLAIVLIPMLQGCSFDFEKIMTIPHQYYRFLERLSSDDFWGISFIVGIVSAILIKVIASDRWENFQMIVFGFLLITFGVGFPVLGAAVLLFIPVLPILVILLGTGITFHYLIGWAKETEIWMQFSEKKAEMKYKKEKAEKEMLEKKILEEEERQKATRTKFVYETLVKSELREVNTLEGKWYSAARKKGLVMDEINKGFHRLIELSGDMNTLRKIIEIEIANIGKNVKIMVEEESIYEEIVHPAVTEMEDISRGFYMFVDVVKEPEWTEHVKVGTRPVEVKYALPYLSYDQVLKISSREKEINNNVLKSIAIMALLSPTLLALSANLGWAGDGMMVESVNWFMTHWFVSGLAGASIGIVITIAIWRFFEKKIKEKLVEKDKQELFMQEVEKTINDDSTIHYDEIAIEQLSDEDIESPDVNFVSLNTESSLSTENSKVFEDNSMVHSKPADGESVYDDNGNYIGFYSNGTLWGPDGWGEQMANLGPMSKYKSIILPLLLTQAIVALSSKFSWAGDGMIAESVNWFMTHWFISGLLGAGLSVVLYGILWKIISPVSYYLGRKDKKKIREYMTVENIKYFSKNLKLRSKGNKIISIEALEKIGNAQAKESLIECLKDPDADVIHDAAIALGRLGEYKAVDSLIELLEHSNNHVRTAAVIALGFIGDEKAAKPIFDTEYKNGYDAAFFSFKVSALCKIGTDKAKFYAYFLDEKKGKIENIPVAIGLLEEILENKNYPYHRYERAAKVLGDIGNSRAGELLFPLLDHPDYVVKFAALKALGKCKTLNINGAEDLLLKEFSSSSIERMKYAAKVLEIINTDKARLYSNLYKGDVEGVLKIPGVFNLLKTPLTSRNLTKDMANCAARALAETGDIRAIELVVKAGESKALSILLNKILPSEKTSLAYDSEVLKKLTAKFGYKPSSVNKSIEIATLAKEWFDSASSKGFRTDKIIKSFSHLISLVPDMDVLKDIIEKEIALVGNNFELVDAFKRESIDVLVGRKEIMGSVPEGGYGNYNQIEVGTGEYTDVYETEWVKVPVTITYALPAVSTQEIIELCNAKKAEYTAKDKLDSFSLETLMNAQESTFNNLNADVLLLCGNDDIGTFKETLRLYKTGKIKKILLTGGYGRLTLPLMKATLKIGVTLKLYDNIIRSADDLTNLQIPGYEEPINLELLDKQPGREEFKKIIQVSEAVFINKIMHFLAKRMNIELDDNDIYLETKSTNTPENFKLAMPYIEQIKKDLGKEEISVAYMQVPHQQFRTMATFNRFSDEWKNMGVTGISYTTDWDTSKLSQEQIVEMAALELWRLVIYTAKGDLVPLYGEQQGLDAVPDGYWKQLAQAVYNLNPAAKEKLKQSLFNLSFGVNIDGEQVFKTEKGLRDYLDIKGVVASVWLDSFITFVYTQSSKQVIVDEFISDTMIKRGNVLKADLNLNVGLALVAQAI